ncbi:MAG: chemotaxis protein, partial [Mesorhizobium sp.]
MRPGWRISTLALGAAVGVTSPSHALEPYQMVRSMQLIQDRVANGDHAAMPMQHRLLGMIDRRLREAEPSEFEDRRNLEALFVYAMSGGNPTTLDVVLSRLRPGTQQDAALARAIGFYLRGDVGNSINALKEIDPKIYPLESGPFIALVKGSVMVADRPDLAADLFDYARLQSPGTLVEEAALRRS